jgi:hypothetical protein
MRKTKYKHITPNLAKIGMAIKGVCLTAGATAYFQEMPRVAFGVAMLGAIIDEVIKLFYDEEL